LPLFTFGKISAGQRAAAAGTRAADALVEAASADAAVDAAKAYWGAKLARESLLMLEDGMAELDAEIARVETSLDAGKGEVTESDRHRLRAVRAEVEVRVAEARKGERLALAGVRLLTGEDDADVDDAPYEAVQAELVEREVARRLARERRPERRAADEAVAAARALADVEKARWWPDIVGLAEAKLARSSATDDPENAFYNDPLNTTSFTAGVALRWTLEAGTRVARVRGARAEEARARATAKLAADGVAADADRAWGEAQDAADRLAATRRGEKEARAWLVTTLQSAAAGLGEPKDVADALVLYFTLRGRTLQAIFDWNVAVVAVQRATGNP
jgi:outer membrane protein TolC